MPVSWFQFFVLADGVDGLEDPNQSDVSSEITENIDIQWISVLSLRGKQYTASRSCYVEESCIDSIIKIEEKFSNVSIKNHSFFFTFSLHSSEHYKTNNKQTNKQKLGTHTHTHTHTQNTRKPQNESCELHMCEC